MRHPDPRQGHLPFPDMDARMGQSLNHPTSRILGPAEPGLMPLTTLLEPFRYVVDYRTYRLMNPRQEPYPRELERMDKLLKKIKALYPHVKAFDGKTPMLLLGLLHTLKKGFDNLSISEAVAVRALTYFFVGEAERFYDSQTAPGYTYSGTPRSFSWPYVVDAFLKRYLSDEVLHEAYQQVTTISQKSDENESDYATRLSTAAQRCNHVFDERTLIHHFVNGLLPTTRSIVTERLRVLPPHEQSDLTVIRRIAFAEGATYRARRQDSAPKPRRNPTMYVSSATPHGQVTPVYAPNSNSVSHDQDSDSPCRALEVATRLDPFLFVTDKSRSTTSTGSTLEDIQSLLTKPIGDIPVLSEDQRQKAYSVIPTDAWQFSCWGCREPAHSLFSCPLLTEKQRLYFAYKYYLWKVQERPHQAKYYAERLETLKQAAGQRQNSQGSNPRNNSYDRGNRSRSQSPRRQPPRSVLRNPDRPYGKDNVGVDSRGVYMIDPQENPAETQASQENSQGQ